MNNEDKQYETIAPYDRIYGRVKASNDCLMTKPSTVRVAEFTGRTETFVVQSARTSELGEASGDYIFVERMDADGVTRIAMPPKVVNAIISQHDSLTTKRRRIIGKRSAKERMDRGELPGFHKNFVKKPKRPSKEVQ
jgi:hypothetical protein